MKPDVITQSGATLIEVGTTNRTHLTDYQQGIQQEADLILSVHPSNFQTLGYTAEVPIETLCTLGLPVIHDLGSGVLAENLPLLAEEPAVRRSIKAGAAVVCFSGDKLLGGPQAGILAGAHQAIEVCRKHPLTRALRIGRLPLAALEATLRLYRDPERALRTCFKMTGTPGCVPETRRRIATCRLARATSTRFTGPWRPAWFSNAPATPSF